MTDASAIIYHYPPELLNLLIEAIPCLCKSKKDMLLFFRGAGVPPAYMKDVSRRVLNHPEEIRKHEIARVVLSRLNEKGEATLRERREVLKRVEEFEDFSACWPNQVDRAKALVADIRRVRNVKDSFTKMRLEKDAELEKRTQESREKAKKAEERNRRLDEFRQDLAALFGLSNPWNRGKQLERFLNRLFTFEDILIRESFTIVGDEAKGIVEQIDGVIEFDNQVYLAEVKWWSERLGPGEVAQHQVRVFNRGHIRGIFISASGYTDAAIDACRKSMPRAVFVLCELEEFVHLLEQRIELVAFLRKKVQSALIDHEPFVKIVTEH